MYPILPFTLTYIILYTLSFIPLGNITELEVEATFSSWSVLRRMLFFCRILASWQEKEKEAAKDTKDLFGKIEPKLPHYEKKILKSSHLGC
jgi:hypothetical protein